MNIEVIFLVYSDYPILHGEQQLPIFLLNMGLHLCQDHVVRPEGHSSPQILFCTRGSGTLVISENRLNVLRYSCRRRSRTNTTPTRTSGTYTG